MIAVEEVGENIPKDRRVFVRNLDAKMIRDDWRVARSLVPVRSARLNWARCFYRFQAVHSAVPNR
jgi:hypothetical protein